LLLGSFAALLLGAFASLLLGSLAALLRRAFAALLGAFASLLLGSFAALLLGAFAALLLRAFAALLLGNVDLLLIGYNRGDSIEESLAYARGGGFLLQGERQQGCRFVQTRELHPALFAAGGEVSFELFSISRVQSSEHVRGAQLELRVPFFCLRGHFASGAATWRNF
jgi:hypothetical protein